MLKRNRSAYIIAAMLIGVVAVLVVLLVFAGTGALGNDPDELVFTSASAQRLYDGSELVAHEYELTSGALKKGHTASVSFSASQRDVGTALNTVTVRIADDQGSDVTDSYVIKTVEGTLTVDPVHYEVRSLDASKTYDGTPLTEKRYGVIAGMLPTGHTLDLSYSGKQTSVGTSANAFTARVTDAKGRDVTFNFDMVCIPGTLEVSKRPVTFKSQTVSAVYDGTTLDAGEIDIAFGSLAVGQTADFAAKVSLGAVGSIDNTFTATIKDENGNDVSDNYDIQYSYGKLTMDKRPITLSSESAEKAYDGTPLFADYGSIASGSAADGHTIAYDGGASVTAVGSANNAFTATVRDGDGNDVGDNYDIKYEYGTLTVTKCALVLSSDSVTRTYDGTPLSAACGRVTGGVLAPGHTVSSDFGTSLTDVGSISNAFTATIYDEDHNDVGGNYDVKYAYGTLTVTPLPITIETADKSRVYDGTPLTYRMWRVIGGDIPSLWISDEYYYPLLGDDELTGDMPSTITAVGEHVNDFVLNGITRGGVSKSGNYEIKYTLGTLTVTRRPITVRSDSDSKDYDGTPLTCSNYVCDAASGSSPYRGLLDGHNADVEVTGSITEPGSELNYISGVSILANGLDVTPNYDITLQYGTLTVRGAGTQLSGPSDTDTLVMRITSANDAERIYLKSGSYGNYTGRGFGPAPVYTEQISYGATEFGYGYLTSLALRNSGFMSRANDINVELIAARFVLPYYALPQGETLQTSDVQYTSALKIYRAQHIDYEYTRDGGALRLSVDLTASENAYASFVRQRYTAVPAATADFLRDFAVKNNLNATSPDIISEAAKTIQKSAKYNLEYDNALDGESDTVVAFLNDYKEGVCRHYAAAATMLYRTLGFPARYTVGYLASNLKSGEVKDVKSGEAHAWVEVYIHGAGWVAVEVTGGGIGGGGNGDGDGDGEGENGNDNTSARTVKPVDVAMKRDGTPLTPKMSGDNYVVQGLTDDYLSRGCTYRAVAIGSQTEVGVSSSVITELEIFSESGALIYSYTDADGDGKGTPTIYHEALAAEGLEYKFDFKIKPGRLHVYEYVLSVKTESASKLYDGTALTANNYTVTGGLQPGHSIVEGSEKQAAPINVGTTDNSFDCKIEDADGNDVTDMYMIEVDHGKLTILPIELRVITADMDAALSELGGQPLVHRVCTILCNGREITDLTGIVDGASLVLDWLGEQSGVGISPNTVIVTVMLNGVNCSSNFVIVYDYGDLFVYED